MYKIYDNYFEGLTGNNGSTALNIPAGNADYGKGAPLTSAFRPQRIDIAFNTFVGNTHNIVIGNLHDRPPRDITIANNIVKGSQNKLVRIDTDPTNMTWLGNIMYPTGTATLGIPTTSSEIRVVDPLLTLSDGLKKILSNSPARDRAITRRPLTPSDVGVDAPADGGGNAPPSALDDTAGQTRTWRSP